MLLGDAAARRPPCPAALASGRLADRTCMQLMHAPVEDGAFQERRAAGVLQRWQLGCGAETTARERFNACSNQASCRLLPQPGELLLCLTPAAAHRLHPPHLSLLQLDRPPGPGLELGVEPSVKELQRRGERG